MHKFNGQPVRNLRHLAEMVAACTDPQMRFDVDYSVSGGGGAMQAEAEAA